MPAERTGYTVTMFCIDVSASMGRTRTVEVSGGEDGEAREVEMTNLEWSAQYVLLKVQEMIFNGRKTDQCGVILFGTEDTNNIINERNGGYERVTEYIPIGQPNNNTLAKIQALQASEENGDPVDAIIVAVETQDDYLKKKKTWTRKMVVLTDGESPIEVEDWELTVKKINELRIITTIIGVDFDDEDFGVKEEAKSKIKFENEKFFHMFTSALDEDLGRIGTAAEAIYECQRPEVKITKSQLNGTVLRLGDFDTRPDEAIELPVKTSKCTALARPAAMKKFVKRNAGIEEEGSLTVADVKKDEDEQDVYAQLKMQTEYYVEKAQSGDDAMDEDGNEEGSKTAAKVDAEQLIRGFKYGASYVPCPDGQFPRLSSRKGIDICGFFPDRFIRRDYGMGEVQYIWPDPTNASNQTAFSSIVQAMLAQNVVAIARFVSRDDMDPRMGLLIPRDFEEVDCFLFLMMPFADDVRRYVFPPLINLVSKKGEKVESHAYLPTTEQEAAMEKFVDDMDLMQAGEKDEEGNRAPWFDPRLSYNPAVHRIKQALFHAAIVQDLRQNPLPPPHQETIKYFEPPRRVLKRAHQALEECKQRFEIKNVPRKVSRKRKDGHVRAEDDDDEPLLLDAPQKRPRAESGKQSTSSTGPTEFVLSTQSTLVNDPSAVGIPVKEGIKDEKMEVDSATEDEDEDEDDDRMVAATSKPTMSNGDVKAAHLTPPAPTFPSNSNSQSQSQSQPFSQSQSQLNAPTDSQLNALSFDDALPTTSSARIGKAHPAASFHSALSKAADGHDKIALGELVREVGEVIQEIVSGPLARRRYEEMRSCLEDVRAVCVKEREAKAWNSCMHSLKLTTASGPSRSFWDFLRSSHKESESTRGEVGLIRADELPPDSGGVSDSSAKTFFSS